MVIINKAIDKMLFTNIFPFLLPYSPLILLKTNNATQFHQLSVTFLQKKDIYATIFKAFCFKVPN